MNMEMERGERNSDTSNLDSSFVDRDGSSSLRRTAESSSGGHDSATEPTGETGFVTFPERLFGFLECEEFRDTIWWNSDGNVFGIDPKGFTEKVLKKHCQGMQFESFTRSLNRWGFWMVVDAYFPNNVRVYRHDMFQRNKPILLQKIITGKKKKDRADNARTYRKGEDSSPPNSLSHGLLQSKPLDQQQLSQHSGFASEGTPLLSLRDSHILPSRVAAYRAAADHQHQVYHPSRSLADLLAEHRLHRLRQEQTEVRLLEAQQDIFNAQTNLRLLQAQKQQEVARFAHFSQISNFYPAHLALHSLQDVSRVPCGVLGVQCVMQSSMVNLAPSSRLLNNTSRTVTQTVAHDSVVSARTDVAVHNGTVSSENLSSIPVVCSSSSQSSTGKRSRQVCEQDAIDEDSHYDSNNDCAEKRRRTVNSESGDSTTQKRRINSYCRGKWEENFDELMRYRQRTGNCLVPSCYKENPALPRWVKRQRYQYTLMIEGQPSSAMTEERVKILEEAGFVWDSQAASWQERLEELKAFRKTQRHCNVPTGYIENIPLVNWVKCQRRQYLFLKEGRKSNMTTQRIDDLESIGFEWQLRPSRYAKKKN
jgi:hypothetical protein